MSYRENAGKVWDLGLQPWPVRHDGTKAPRGDGWSRNDLPVRLDRESTLEMFRPDDTGMGVITGIDHLELFEFEGRFVNDGGWDEFVSACNDRDLGEVLETIRQGYEVASPSGGVHLMFRTDGPALPNTKLASRDVDGTILPLIETRGDRGFAVLAGSNGRIHPEGGSWKILRGKPRTIATISCDERDALYELAREFDEAPEKPRYDPKLLSIGSGIGLDGGDMGDLQDYVVSWIGVSILLAEAGWTQKRPGSDLWRRPGKDWGWSGQVWPDGCFSVYTTTLSEPWRIALNGREQLTPIGVLAAVRHGGDVRAAMSATRRGLSANATPQADAIDAETGEILALNLPDEFWEQSQLLRDVRDAAWANTCSPDAVLGALLVRYSATIPPSVTLPGEGSLDLFTVCVGHSGAGKSKAAKVARRLFKGEDKKGVLLDLPVGSGEGLVEKYFRFEDDEGKPCSPRKTGAQKVQWLHGLHFTTDEGMALNAQAGRSGSTLIPTLCSAWFGETLGQTNAQAETSRSIPPGRARMTAQINIQTANGYKLFADEYASTGLSQRMLCVYALDERLADTSFELPEMPPPLRLPMPAANREIPVDATIMTEITNAQRAAHAPTWSGNPLDTHRNMVKLKVAALLAFMDGRDSVAVADWELADQIYDVHRRIRSLLESTHQIESAKKARAGAQAEAMRQLEVGKVTIDATVIEATNWIRKRIEAGKPITKNAMPMRLREHREEALGRLEEEGLVVEGDTGWHVKGV